VTLGEEVIYQAFQPVYFVFDCLYFYIFGVIIFILSCEMNTSVTPPGVQGAFDVKSRFWCEEFETYESHVGNGYLRV